MIMNTEPRLRIVDTSPSDGETPPQPGDELVVAAFARVRPLPLGLSVGIVTGLGLFIATATLLIAAQGSSADVAPGGHLSLLANFLPGYSITWPGAILGSLYGVLVGSIIGVVLGCLLNLSHFAYVRIVQRRLTGGVLQDAL